MVVSGCVCVSVVCMCARNATQERTRRVYVCVYIRHVCVSCVRWWVGERAAYASSKDMYKKNLLDLPTSLLYISILLYA